MLKNVVEVYYNGSQVKHNVFDHNISVNSIKFVTILCLLK